MLLNFETVSMSEIAACIVQTAIFVAMIIGSWLFPRAFGLLGLFAAHFCNLLGVVSLGYVASVAGFGPVYEPIEVFGSVVQGVVFNVLTLPLSVWAMVRWRKRSPMSMYYEASD